MGKKKAIKSFKRFSETATMHGLYKIGHSPTRWSRLLWTVVVAGLFAGFVVEIVKLFKEHYSYKTYVKLDKQTLSKMEFPSVTICEANNFRLSVFKKFLPNVETLVQQTNFMGLQMDQIYTPRNFHLFQHLDMLRKNISVVKELSSTYYANKTLFHDWCTWSSVFNCKVPDDFADYFYMAQVGFCKTFNPKGKYVQISPGNRFGLTLKLFIDQTDKVPYFTDYGAGVLVMIHPKDVYPNPFSEGMLVQTGHVTRISLKKVISYRKKSPYPSKCSDGKGIFQVFPGAYTVNNCQYSCAIKLTLEKCGDIELAYKYHKPAEFAKSMGVLKKTNISNTNMIKCYQSLVQKFLNNKLACNCPAACKEERIFTSATSTQWPQPADMGYYKPIVAKLMNKSSVTNEEVHNGMVFLEIYYDELSIDIISEEVASIWTKVVSNVGGQLGLWLGASIFSLIEIIGYLSTSIVRLYDLKVGPSSKQKDKDIPDISL